MTRVGWLNRLPDDDVVAELRRCCGSERWARRMAAERPFADREELLEAADRVWSAVNPEDWLEAFSHHPRIGGADLRERRFDDTRSWSAGEQSGMAGAEAEVRRRLAELNDAYYERFGYVFLINATGKGAAEMLAALEERIDNDPADELAIAAEQQRQITRLRLEKLLDEAEAPAAGSPRTSSGDDG